MRDLAGRCAIVTGASSGIGKYVARALAGKGMRVVLAARSETLLQQAADEIRPSGARVLAVPTDVTQPADRERLVEQALSEFGRIDVLVNNAGIETYCPFEDLPIEDMARTIDVNLTSALILTRLVVPHMLSCQAGHIINMSSTAGKHGPAYGTAYGVSKAGLVSMTESLRSEFRGRGISASVICPGFTHEGGIYERMKQDTGRTTPRLMGATTAEAVARAVVKAIKNDRPEVLVNVPPMRPVFVLAELWPALGEWVIGKASLRYLKRIATRRSQTSSHPPAT